jgi:hypothetical protein
MPEVALIVFGPVHKRRGASACDVGRCRSRRREGKPMNLREISDPRFGMCFSFIHSVTTRPQGRVNGDGSGDGLPVPNGGE